MVSLNWCLNQKRGLFQITPNENMATAYMKMAEESLLVLSSIEQSKLWTASATYYTYYYTLYALMLRFGFKCEIHSCSLLFMDTFLTNHYTSYERELVHKAFDARQDLQYYPDRAVESTVLEELKKGSKIFYIKTKDILANVKETEIEELHLHIKTSLQPKNRKT